MMQTVGRRVLDDYHLLSLTTACVSRRLLSNFPEFVRNRNPRNLERLCIARKPSGYHLESPGKYEFWHCLQLERSSKHVTASVIHHTGGVPPVTASTKEWALRRWLYSATDVSAFTNLATVLAHRCLATGIQEVHCNIPNRGHKTQVFLRQLEKSGIALKEPPQYVHPKPSDKERPEKPWLVYED